MPRKGMRLIGFSPKSSSTTSSGPYCSESVMDRTLEIAEPVIMKWNPEELTSLFHESGRRSSPEADEFVKCVKNLHKAMKLLAMEHLRSEKFLRAQSLMEVAMERLQKEFSRILNTNRAHFDPESVSSRSSISTNLSGTSSDFDVDDDNSEDNDVIRESIITEAAEDGSSVIMANMRLIVECMISCGYAKECLRIYTDIRKSIVDEAVFRLEFEKMSSSQVRKTNWELLKMRIKNWQSAFNVAVKTLFNAERILCDNFFASSSDGIRELIFKDITKEAAMNLFEFPENIAKNCKISPDRIFTLLEMYIVIANNWPEIESIFSTDYSVSAIRTQAVTSLVKLGESIRASLAQFETALLKLSSKSTIVGGGIHSLTVDAMKYLTSIANYSNVLSDIFSGTPPVAKDELPESYFAVSDADESSSPAISLRFAWLILVLLCKLDAIADHYKDISIAYLFLANNLQYVVVQVRSSNLNHLLGENWLSKQSAKVKQYMANYERLGWSDVISSLPGNHTAPMSPEEIKRFFKGFNSSFEQAHRKYSVCVVYDRNLRDQLKVSLARKLVRIYRDFYNTHKLRMTTERNFGSIVKFAPEDVGHRLSDLFFEPAEFRNVLSHNSSMSRTKLLRFQ